MKKLLLILLCLPMIGFGQNVYIPDANFKAYLVGDSAINTNGDSEIQVSEANSFNGAINCGNMNIYDLTGIEDFTSLSSLSCFNNQLTSIDLSNNNSLTYLYCTNNQLTSLDLSTNTFLMYLHCRNNFLTNLDVSNNTGLTYLDCSTNQLTSIDVSQNTGLTELNCSNNQIAIIDVSNNSTLINFWCNNNQINVLDISNNTNLIEFWCSNNPLIVLNVNNGNNTNMTCDFVGPNLSCGGVFNITSVSCVEVDDPAWSYMNWVNGPWQIAIDTTFQYFSTNCSTTSIKDYIINKELLKVTDLLGRETKQTNQPLIYLYDDGTVEKKITID